MEIGQQTDHAAVGQGDTLGPAGGTGRINDVGEVVWADGLGGVGVWLPADGIGFQADSRAGEGGQALPQSVACDQQMGASVVQHEGQALGRVGGIERHVGAAGFQDA